MTIRKTRRILLIVLFGILGSAFIIFAWTMIKPIQVTYRDSIDMNIGGSKTVLFKIEKLGTIFSFIHANFSFGVFRDGKLQALPDYLGVKETGSSPVLPPSGKDQITYIEISTSPNISPGQYLIYAQLRIAGIRLGRLPITVTIKESEDDIVNTSKGPIYRGNLPDNSQWEPVKEKTAELGALPVFLTYRDTVNMTAGDYKVVLLNFNSTDARLDVKNFSYQVGVLGNGNLGLLPSVLQIENIELENQTGAQVSAITFKLANTWSEVTLHLGIQITVEGIDILGTVPLTVNILSSADDLFPTPAGVFEYSANVNGATPGGYFGSPIKEKTVRLPW